MQILNEYNRAINTDQITDHSETYYCFLDLVKPKAPDYRFEPLVFVETYQAASAVLEIGPYTVVLPFKWSILITDMDQAEVVPIEDLDGADFKVFCINPINGYIPKTLPVRVVELHKNATWTCPPMNKNKMLVVPIGYERDHDGSKKEEPLCIIVGEQRLKSTDVMDLAMLW